MCRASEHRSNTQERAENRQGWRRNQASWLKICVAPTVLCFFGGGVMSQPLRAGLTCDAPALVTRLGP